MDRVQYGRGMASEGNPRPAGKITVNLGQRAQLAMKEATTREQISQTDLVNRAVGLFNFWTAQRSEGAEILVRRPDGVQYRLEMF